TSAFASPMINSTPTEQTPVAIDPDQVEPNNVQ
ncbi:MAG: BON domain-containing protein, partial [Acinetobacter johnsonii]